MVNLFIFFSGNTLNITIILNKKFNLQKLLEHLHKQEKQVLIGISVFDSIKNR